MLVYLSSRFQDARKACADATLSQVQLHATQQPKGHAPPSPIQRHKPKQTNLFHYVTLLSKCLALYDDTVVLLTRLLFGNLKFVIAEQC